IGSFVADIKDQRPRCMFFPHKCPSPTPLKDRTVRDPHDPTKYDNWRPSSVLSFSTYSRAIDRSTASISALQTVD
ncbi:hypothetical protein PENTCL1PPCAC_9839, partial [Pristionchus entomophagus]